MKALMIILMVLVLGSLLIISNNDLSLGKSGDFEKFSSLWFGWVGKIFTNVGEITGNAVKMEWVPG